MLYIFYVYESASEILSHFHIQTIILTVFIHSDLDLRVQSAAVAAIPAFTTEYFGETSKTARVDLIHQYLSMLK